MNEHHDHQYYNPLLDLYANEDLVGSGLPLWKEGGSVIRAALEEYAREDEARRGYSRVSTPVLAKRELFERSGHWGNYQDSMFAPVVDGDSELVLRPMSCPHHALVFKASPRSYRQMPVRLSEMALLHRDERSGSLNGLSRVRAMTLADAHLFVMEEQVEDEVVRVLEEIKDAYHHLGLEAARFRLSLRGSSGKFVDDALMWDKAEAGLRNALVRAGLPYEEERGEGAFYGPKIDVQVKNARGREETLSTVQLDFHLPAQFELEYVGADGARHRPVLVHRSALSTMERMVAFLVERHQGRLPLWLAPRAVVVLPLNQDCSDYADEVVADLVRGGVRAEVLSDGSLNARVRASVLVPVVLVVGGREREARSISVRAHGAVIGVEAYGDVVTSLVAAVEERAAALPW